VVKNLLKDEKNPPSQIWRGGAAGTVKLSNTLDGMNSADSGDSSFMKLGGLDKLEKILAEQAAKS
jgi:hypothetical protein